MKEASDNMNHFWKKSVITAALGFSLLASQAAVNAESIYTANDNDTFWTLASRFSVTVEEWLKANPDVDPGNIYEGLQLVIPNSAAAAVVAAAEPSSEPAAKAAAAGAAATLAAAKPAAQQKAKSQTAQPEQAAKSAAGNQDASASKAKQTAKSVPAKTASAKKAAPATPKKATSATVKKTTSATAQKATAKSAGEKQVTISGTSRGYSKVLQVKASAYTAAASENGSWGAVDYFGNPLKLGTIAVDPSVIPMGSKVYITGYDHDGLPVGGMTAIAADQGSAINGNRIDIFVPQSQAEASEFGYQYVKVYILQ